MYFLIAYSILTTAATFRNQITVQSFNKPVTSCQKTNKNSKYISAVVTSHVLCPSTTANLYNCLQLVILGASKNLYVRMFKVVHRSCLVKYYLYCLYCNYYKLVGRALNCKPLHLESNLAHLSIFTKITTWWRHTRLETFIFES